MMDGVLIFLMIVLIVTVHGVRRAIETQHETLKSIRNRVDPAEFKVIE